MPRKRVTYRLFWGDSSSLGMGVRTMRPSSRWVSIVSRPVTPSASRYSRGSCTRPVRSTTVRSSTSGSSVSSSPPMRPRLSSESFRRTNSLLVRPSRIITARLTKEDTSRSWVTMTMVIPSWRFSCWKSWSSSLVVLESTAPVGSSASSRRGLLASAMAMATRCCSPPESSVRRLFFRWESPTRERSAPARSRTFRQGIGFPSGPGRGGILAGSAPLMERGSSTFCCAVR